MMPLPRATSGLLCLLATGRNTRDDSLPSSVFIGGLGYAGSRIASAFHDAHPSAKVSGTVRSTERREALLSSRPAWLTGNVHVLDIGDEYVGLDQGGVADLLGADAIVQTIAPIADFDRDPILAFHGESLLGRRTTLPLKYVAYISSTGVYGNHDGGWVAEEEGGPSSSSEVLRCTDAKSLARVRAEKEWGKLEQRNEGNADSDEIRTPRVDCFRCGGIYGPGRGPLFSPLESLTESLSSPAEDDDADNDAQPVKYVNRIIVDDICSAILSGMRGNRPYHPGGRAYNLVDDEPSPRRAVVAEARRLILSARRDGKAEGTAPLPSSSPNVAAKSGRRRISRGTGNKRCSNARLKREYGWAPGAPSFREGLASMLDEYS